MLKKILPHLCIVISVMMIVIYVLDHLNNAMNFINNNTFKSLLLVYSIIVIASSIFLIVENRRHNR